jgi:hypothetical protein
MMCKKPISTRQGQDSRDTSTGLHSSSNGIGSQTKMVKKITRSRFDLKRLPDLPQSLMVVDGIRVVYDTVNFINLEQFTIAI